MTLFGKTYKQVLQIDYLIWVPSKSVEGKYLLQVKKKVLIHLGAMSTNTYLEEWDIHFLIHWHYSSVFNWEPTNSLKHNSNNLLKIFNKVVG